MMWIELDGIAKCDGKRFEPRNFESFLQKVTCLHTSWKPQRFSQLASASLPTLDLSQLFFNAQLNFSAYGSLMQLFYYSLSSSIIVTTWVHSLVLSRTFNRISDYFWSCHHRTSPDTPELLLFLPLRFFNKWNRKTMSVGLMLLISWFVINFPNPIITCHMSRTEKSGYFFLQQMCCRPYKMKIIKP